MQEVNKHMGEKHSKKTLREIANATKNRREIVEAGLTRREMVKMGLLTSAGMLVPIKGLSARWADPKHRVPLHSPIEPAPDTFPGAAQHRHERRNADKGKGNSEPESGPAAGKF